MFFQNVVHKVAAYETCATCHKESHVGSTVL